MESNAARPPYPALHATHGGIWIASPNGEVRGIGRGEATARAAETPMIVLNAAVTGSRLGYRRLVGLDLLELFAFLHPRASRCRPRRGLARALGLTPPPDDARAPAFLIEAAQALLGRIEKPGAWPEREGAWNSAQSLARLRWPWAPAVRKVLRVPVHAAERWLFARLPEWDEGAAPAAAAQCRTGRGRDARPPRRLTGARVPSGARGAARYAERKRPPGLRRRASREGRPNIVLAEAGTGIGKTLGYLAPASLWAERADGAVWISTYTKALQRQLDKETRRLFPDPRAAREGGRAQGSRKLSLPAQPGGCAAGRLSGRAAILAQLVARWAASIARDGDMVGGDLPGWLPTLFRRNGSTALTDRRGECVYAGCPHYRKCFIERAARASEAPTSSSPTTRW
jgi:ATP-dependent DNA helicase DinG